MSRVSSQRRVWSNGFSLTPELRRLATGRAGCLELVWCTTWENANEATHPRLAADRRSRRAA